MSKQKVKDRVSELAEEYGVSRQVVWALYDIMPNELYDGIPDALENIDSLGLFKHCDPDDKDQEKLF